MHIAIAGVHVQRDEYPTTQHFLMHCGAFIQNQFKRRATENLTQLRTHFRFPRHADRTILQHMEYRRIRLLEQTFIENVR